MKNNWAIVGTGWAANDMAAALKQENGDIYAVMNPHREHADQFAKKYQIQHSYYNYKEMLADPNIKIVYIATPHVLHFEQIKQALMANKHVLCEKAITINAAQFDAVEKLSRDNNLILMEGFTLYHMPLYHQLQTLITDGHLGELKLVQVNFGSLKNPDPNQRFFKSDLAGGALLDIGGYAVAFARMFLNNLHVAGTSVKFYKTGVDEMSSIILKNSDEQMATISLSFRAKQPKRGVVSGTKGFIEINNYPRATNATLTTTLDAHTSTETTINAGVTDAALQYEIRDMQRYLELGHDEGELQISHDVAHLLDDIRTDWGLRYPFENQDHSELK